MKSLFWVAGQGCPRDPVIHCCRLLEVENKSLLLKTPALQTQGPETPELELTLIPLSEA